MRGIGDIWIPRVRSAAALLTVVIFGALSATSAFGNTLLDASLIETSGEPSVAAGKFYGYRSPSVGPGEDAFQKAKTLAEEEGVPLVVVWSHESCHFCDRFIADLNANKSNVASWLGVNRAVFTFFKATGYNGPHTSNYAAAGPGYTEPTACLDAWTFVTGTCRAQPVWPLIGFYYRQPDGKAIVWGHANREEKDFAYLCDEYAKWIEKYRIGLYCGGQFTDVGSEFNRYEAEATTTNVLVKLVRDEVSAADAWSNELIATWPDETGETVTTRVDWVMGQTSTNVAVRLRRAEKPFPVGEAISLVLYDAERGGAPVATNFIHCVELENAAANPKWIGEEFEFGEWTMDLDAAKAKVAAAEGEAFTVVSLQGSKWCPDCANVDRNFLDLTNAAGGNAFCDWAKARQVALVTVDIPNFNGPNVTDYASPSLLDRRAFSSTLARAKEWPQSGADASLTNAMARSGLGYLSRKSVDETTAASYFRRNHDLAVKSTDQGGFHRPEDTNANRTGVPIFVLLRKDGSVAARLTRMASVSPTESDRANFANYVKRFEEMLAIADAGEHGDSSEIENNSPLSTSIDVAADGGVVSNELCNADFQDAFRLVGANGGVRQEVTLSGSSGAKVNVSFCRIANGTVETIAAEDVVISNATPIVCDFVEKGDYFVQVKGTDITSPEFDLANAAASNFQAYALAAWSVLVPREYEQRFSVPDGNEIVKMSVVRGKTYRVLGIDGGVAGEFEPIGNDFYAAKVDKDVSLKVPAGAGREVVYQLWRPGAIAFADRNVTITEYVGTGTVTVVRRDGSSGRCEVRVVCTDGVPKDPGGRYEWVNTNVCWEDGESGERFIRFPVTPNGTTDDVVGFTLALEKAEGPAAVSAEACEVTVLDSNRPCLEKAVYALSANLDFETQLSFKTFNVSNAASVSVKCTSGSVPPGLSLVYDAEAETLRLSGVPRVESVCSFVVTLSEKRGRETVTGFATTIVIDVQDRSSDNPSLARARPNETIPLFEELGPGTNVVAGTLRWAITSRNQISARYSGAGGETLSFAGNWSGIDDVDGLLTGRLVSAGAELSLSMDYGGRTELELGLPDGRSYFASSDWPAGESFTNYLGTYNVTFPNLLTKDARGSVAVEEPTGTGFISCRMTSRAASDKGVMVYAGAMPDGSAISGSGYLLRDRFSLGFAYLPVFRRSGGACFSAALEIGENGKEKWATNSYTEGRVALDREIVNAAAGTKAMFIRADYAWEFVTLQEVCGSYFVPGISPQELVGLFYEGSPSFEMAFGEGWAAVSNRYGRASVSAGGKFEIEIGERKLTLVERTDGLAFAYNPQTGVFAGSAKIQFENGKKAAGQFRGILIPGWTSCGCGLENPPLRPFGSGTFRFRDALGPYLVTRSFPVDIDEIKLLTNQ